MKKISAILISFFFPVFLFSQIPNSGFEDWTNMITYNNPSQWSTLNDVTAPSSNYTCLKGTPGSPGSSYIKLVSKNVNGMGLKPGIAVSGSLNTTSMMAISGFPFTGRPEALLGKWQYMASGSDQAYISILLTQWNTTSLSRDTISYVYKPLAGMAMSWANFSIPITYTNNSFPDSATITLSASNANGAATAANSYLYVDNLSFKNTIYLSINEITKQELKVYPNPVTSFLNVDFTGTNSAVLAEIYDIKGNLASYNTWYSRIDVSKLPYGTYFLKLTNGSDSKSQLFIKN
jgi:hypothetical protein